jgi:AAA family ATP:ADP antiporter
MFADIYFWTNTLTLAGQLFLTGRFLRRFGAGAALGAQPVAIAVGALILGTRPTLGVLVVFEVIRRAGNYAFVKPARETLFTLVDRNVRYKAKSFIDTFVYRTGDVVGAGTDSALTALVVAFPAVFSSVLGALAVTIAPFAVVWAGLGLYLGTRQKHLAGQASPLDDPTASTRTTGA